MSTEYHHFVLIHGSGHGAWCWYKLTKLLLSAGHTVDALDLTSAGICPVEAKSVSGIQHYAAPLIRFLESLPPQHPKVVLVGHSFGGLSLTYALQHFPEKIAAAVYVAGLMYPSESMGGREIFNQVFIANKSTENGVTYGFPPDSPFPSTSVFHLDAVQRLLYHLSPPEDVILAKTLLKPSPLFDQIIDITDDKYGTVPRYYIKAMQDKIIPPHLQELMIEHSQPCVKLEVDSDHSPFFSIPQMLAQHLIDIVSL